MKKYFVLIINIILASTPVIINITPVSGVYAATKKISLAIIDFDNNSGIKEWDYMQKGVPRILVANLAQNKGIKILEREKLDKALKELKFSQTGLVDPDTARKLGKLIGADYAMYGSITRFGTNRPTIIIDATIMEIQTGEVKFVESVRGNDENSIINLLDKLSVMLLNDLVPMEEQKPNNLTVDNNNQNSVKPNELSGPSKLNLNDKLVFSAQNEKQSRQIYISGNSGSVYKLTSSQAGNNTPVWSPDGSKIAFVNQKYGITVFDLKNNMLTQFSSKPVSDKNPKWTSDGNKIIFLTKEKNNYAIYIGNKDGSEQKALSPEHLDVKSFSVSNNDTIAFCAKTKTKGNITFQIYSMDSHGKDLKQLTYTGSNAWPEWSPDGKKITFVSDRLNFTKVYIMESNGFNQLLLSKGTLDEETPVWSPDGQKIAFISMNENKGKVSIINVDGSGQKILTNDGSDNFDLTWMSNSKEVAFTYK